MGQFEDETKAFEEFLTKKGIEISEKVAIEDFRLSSQGRGLVALDNISEGETLFSIPPSALLRADTDPQLRELLVKYESDEWSALMIRMMAVQSSEEWKPYFNILPKSFNTPMFWSSEETHALLKGSEVVNKIGREEADALYDELANGILTENYFKSLPGINREAFHRMGSLIMSYAFDVPATTGGGYEEDEDHDEHENDDDENETTKAMVPLADILNSHTKLQNAKLTIPETAEGSYEMVATRDIAKGDQIYNIYGNQPSSDMLRRYGFVEIGGTAYEVAEIGLNLVKTQAQETLKISEETITHRLEEIDSRIGELPSTFEIGLTVDEDTEDAVPEIEFEPELLITVNALIIPELKRKNFKEIVAMVEADRSLYPEARKLLAACVQQRKKDYGEVPELQLRELPESQVLLDKQDMCTQVRLAELHVLDMASDWLNDSESAEPPTKRKKL